VQKWTQQGANSSTACPTCGGASEALRQITFHALRHSGTTLVADRVPLVVLKERRGHASVTTTANIYVHRSRWTGAVAVEQLEQPFPALEKAEAGRGCDASRNGPPTETKKRLKSLIL
jgi:hypothetical protein